MVNVQEWLDKNYPEEERSEIKELDAKNRDLEGQLVIENFPKLERIECGNNRNLTKVEILHLQVLSYFHANNCRLTDIKIVNCPKINYLNVANNYLTDSRFLNYLESSELVSLSIHTNNFNKQKLDFLSKFTNLKNLFLDNADQAKFEKGIYNKFYGSLKPLKDLDKLEILSIGNTNIDSGLEYLADSFRKIGLTSAWQTETSCFKLCQEIEKSSRVEGVNEELKCHEENDPAWFDDYYRIASWRKARKILGEEGFNKYLRETEITSEIEENKNEFYEVKEWLDNNYPRDKRRERNFLNINNKNLTSELVLSDFVNLQKLNCSNNQLTSLDCSDCIELRELYCSNNKLNTILGIKNCNKLISIDFDNNFYNESSLSMLKELKLFISEGKWKKKLASEWLKKEYPVYGKCLGNFDLENKNREREKIQELDISGEELEGELNLEGFKELKYLNCRNNGLTGIDLSDCSKLEVIDCQKNEITSLKFSENKLLLLKEFHCSNNRLSESNLITLLENIGDENLTYFDINDNNVNGEVSLFSKFSKLEMLYIGGNKFKNDDLMNFKNLQGLLEINIRDNNIEVRDFFEQKEEATLTKLEKIFCSFSENFRSETQNYYNNEGGYYDFESFRNHNLSEVFEIETILKTPNISRENGAKISRIDENYKTEKIDYYKSGKIIYPSKNEKWFEWEVGESLPLSKLPLRLVYISEEISEKGERQAEIKIKKRIECADEVKHYAILSYSWGGKHREDIGWSLENAQKRLSPGGIKSLDKAIKTLEILNYFHLQESDEKIKYLWMDQLCVNQNNSREKSHEIPKMREYYGNSAVTLIAIHADIGEENIRKLIKSFNKGESGLVYPNEIIESSLPVLEKIIGSEWFSRSWTFQEGFLSKRTIFMFDDFLLDGRFMALIWKLKQFSEAHYEECKDLESLCREKVATPVGWSYYKDIEKRGYSYRDKASLRLNEALWVIKNRGRALPLDGIYSIIGLLPYGDKVKVDYGKEPESVLREVMLIAIKNGYGEPLSWHGSGSKKPGLCWVPEIDISGSSSVTGTIRTNYLEKEMNFMPNDEGLLLMGSEYLIAEKSGGIYKLGKEETVDGGLWMRKISVEVNDGRKERLTLSGTKKGIESIGKGRVLIIPNYKKWKSNVSFAVLALVEKGDIRHRIDLLRIEEGYEKLIKDNEEEKKFVIGFNNQEITEKKYITQIEIAPKN